jgi:site-specific recombinase XerD
MTQTTQSISPLRQRMIDDMLMRKLSPKTQHQYIRAVKNLARYLGRSPDTATAEDLRKFQLHLVDQGVSRITLNANLTALKFFFVTTLDRADALSEQPPAKAGGFGLRLKAGSIGPSADYRRYTTVNPIIA